MSATGRMIAWRGTDGWRAEMAEIAVDASGLVARGTQIGAAPSPYRLDYALDASAGFVTRLLEIAVSGDRWRRGLRLTRDPDTGAWLVEAVSEGEGPDMPQAGGAPDLAGALDCDLGFSPLTNAMPVARSGLAHRPGGEDFLMAWVSVPDLAVHASAQRYEHLASGRVRYIDRGLFDGVTADLDLDDDGLVLTYPGLAERVPQPVV